MEQYPDKPAFQKFFNLWVNDRKALARLDAPNKRISLYWETGETEDFFFTSTDVAKQIYKEVVVDRIFGPQHP